MKRLLGAVTTGLAVAGAAFSVAAAGYPEKPITFVIPYSAGGSSDMLVRGLQPYVEKAMGATIVPKNVEGGGGAVGISQAVFSSKPDGYTVTLPSNAIFGLEALGNVPWKHQDFDTIARIITEDYTITVRGDSDWKTLDDFIKHAKANPGKVKMGFSGFGSSTHVVAAAFAEKFGLDFQYVPYQGGSKTVAATMGGHIDANTHHPAEVKSGVDAGKIRVLAVMGDKRSNLFPDVPTLKELGHNWVVSQWRGISVAKGVPDEVKAKWEDAIKKASADPTYQKFVVEQMGGTVAPLFGKDLDAYVKEMADIFIPTTERLKAAQKK
ncbi:MAG: tripartite tricarboxylate transporter substrate binding protein [Rhodospirillales bacterium]|nr:tripartite tricarboxylate transporter substrate binding protein [Rhodospirillales bacterium]